MQNRGNLEWWPWNMTSVSHVTFRYLEFLWKYQEFWYNNRENYLNLTNHYAITSLLNLGDSTTYDLCLYMAAMDMLEHRRIVQAFIIFFMSFSLDGPNYISQLYIYIYIYIYIYTPRLIKYNLRGSDLMLSWMCCHVQLLSLCNSLHVKPVTSYHQILDHIGKISLSLNNVKLPGASAWTSYNPVCVCLYFYTFKNSWYI